MKNKQTNNKITWTQIGLMILLATLVIGIFIMESLGHKHDFDPAPVIHYPKKNVLQEKLPDGRTIEQAADDLKFTVKTYNQLWNNLQAGDDLILVLVKELSKLDPDHTKADWKKIKKSQEKMHKGSEKLEKIVWEK